MLGAIGMTGNVALKLHKGVISCLKAAKKGAFAPNDYLLNAQNQ
jgi:hypothetical protein